MPACIQNGTLIAVTLIGKPMGVLLCLNLPTIQEAEYNPAVMVDRDNINHLKPKPRIKDCQFTGLALNPLHVGFDSLCLIQPFFQVLFRGLDLGNDVIVACSQGVVLGFVFSLILCRHSILGDAFPGQADHHFQFATESLQIGIERRGVCQHGLHDAAVLAKGILVPKEGVVGGQKALVNVQLVQMGCRAFFTLKFAVALPNNPAVLAVGIPHLGTVEAAAVAANNP